MCESTGVLLKIVVKREPAVDVCLVVGSPFKGISRKPCPECTCFHII